MEEIWRELREIEKEAEHIRSEALGKSEEIIAIAREDAGKLVSDSKKYAEEEADELLDRYVRRANREREVILEKNREAIRELRVSVENRINKAVKIVFDAVLEKVDL